MINKLIKELGGDELQQNQTIKESNLDSLSLAMLSLMICDYYNLEPKDYDEIDLNISILELQELLQQKSKEKANVSI